MSEKEQNTGRVVEPWFSGSLMAQNGVGRNDDAQFHFLSEERQKKYHFTVGPYSDPVLTIKPGDRVRVETIDTFSGRIQKETDRPTELIELPFLDPQNGPIMVEGAEKGDVLAVYIESMIPRGNKPYGTAGLIPNFGALSSNSQNPILNDPLPEVVRKVHIDEEFVYWDDDFTIPYKPHLGAISCSPELDSINSMVASNHGGNMDVIDVGPGAVIYLPVRSPGGRLFMGDAHACQGDGELCGCAVEFATTTTVRVDLIKNWKIEWPRLERDDYVLCLASARPLEDAVKLAYREMIDWMVADYGFDTMEAYLLLTQLGRVRLGNIVDPNFTVGAGIDKKWLERKIKR